MKSKTLIVQYLCIPPLTLHVHHLSPGTRWLQEHYKVSRSGWCVCIILLIFSVRLYPFLGSTSWSAPSSLYSPNWWMGWVELGDFPILHLVSSELMSDSEGEYSSFILGAASFHWTTCSWGGVCGRNTILLPYSTYYKPTPCSDLM